MASFKTLKFRISTKELNAVLLQVGLLINDKKFEKWEDLREEWQITLTRIERKS